VGICSSLDLARMTLHRDFCSVYDGMEDTADSSELLWHLNLNRVLLARPYTAVRSRNEFPFCFHSIILASRLTGMDPAAGGGFYFIAATYWGVASDSGQTGCCFGRLGCFQ
jgi:hypothetical protein